MRIVPKVPGVATSFKSGKKHCLFQDFKESSLVRVYSLVNVVTKGFAASEESRAGCRHKDSPLTRGRPVVNTRCLSCYWLSTGLIVVINSCFNFFLLPLYFEEHAF